MRRLGDSVRCVLGNHDLHLLALAHGIGRHKRKDTLGDLLAATDADQHIDWLMSLPLAHLEGERALVHAGVSPSWDRATLEEQSNQTVAAMRDDPVGFFTRMYGNQPARWDPDDDAESRHRYTVNSLTRMRWVSPDGALDFDHKLGPDRPHGDLLPWFAHPKRVALGMDVYFGHWSTLGRVAWPEYRVWGLDTGCVWGGSLTAIDVRSGRRVAVPAVD